MTTRAPELSHEPCRCPAQPGAHATAVQHDPAVCLLLPENHQVTVLPRIDAGPGNWLATCTCGRTANMAGPATYEAAVTSATEAASGAGTFNHAWSLQHEINQDAAQEDLAWLATRADACRYLADQACWTDAPDPDEPQRVRYAYTDAIKELEDPEAEPTPHTREHLDLALAVALGELHPPAADPEYHADVILVELPVRWRGEGARPVPEEIVAEVRSRLPRWLQTLDEDDPAAWALGEPRVAGSEPLMVDLTRPARWHEPGTPNGREDGWAEHEHTLRVEFGDHFEPGWYLADHGPEVPAYRGPFETAQQAILGVQVPPTATVVWLGAHPAPETR